MLFPLDQKFNSTGLFQRGCTSDPVRKRVWSIDKKGHHERVLELHKVLTDKKPFSHHLDLVQRQAEEGAKLDAEHTRRHKESINELYSKINESNDQLRQTRSLEIREAKKKHADNSDAIAQAMRSQSMDFVNWRKEMEGRVGSMAPLCGTPHPGEPPERTERRSQAYKDVMLKTREHFQGLREMRETINGRKSMPILPSRAGTIEAKKAAGIAELTQTKREWEKKIQGLYEKHHDRVMTRNEQNEAEHGERQAYKERFLQSSMEMRLSGHHKARQELDSIKDRVKATPKAFAGYKPLPKSAKRERDEAADAYIAQYGM